MLTAGYCLEWRARANKAQITDDIDREGAGYKMAGRRRRTMVVIVMKLEIYIARWEALEIFHRAGVEERGASPPADGG